MKQYVLKSIASSIILIRHFSIIILILVMYFRSGFAFLEATSTISIYLPITSVYTSAIVKDITVNREIDQRTQKTYSLGFVIISCTITLMFIVYLTIIIVKAYNLGIADFDQFKTFLVLGETIFAAYIGQIVHAMFTAGSTEVTEPSGASAPGPGER